MLFKEIAILDENLDYQPGKWVGIEGDRIAYLGDDAPADQARFGRVYEGAGKLLVPGLYNAHAHAPMTMLRGFAENLPLQRWLEERCWPFEDKMTPEDGYWATLLACAEMARYGVIGFSDMYYAAPERARAVTEAGLKANLCEGLLAFEPKPFAEYPQCAQNEELVRTLHGSAEGRILIDYCIHAEYTSNPQVCQDIAQVVAEKGLRLQLHLSETEKEVAECRERHGGMSPVEHFAQLGVFDVPCTAAHCVWVDDADMTILKDKGVFVANNLDPAVVSPKDVLWAASRMGALSQGRQDCGLVKEGFKADLAVMDVTGPQWCPMTQPIYNVVFAGDGSDVVLTLCDGQVVYEAGEWPGLDLEQVKAEVTARTKRIISEL